MTPEQRQAREMKRYLIDLTNAVRVAIADIDKAMKRESDATRGKQIAAAVGALELAHDRAWHFGLGKSLKTLSKLRKDSAT